MKVGCGVGVRGVEAVGLLKQDCGPIPLSGKGRPVLEKEVSLLQGADQDFRKQVEGEGEQYVGLERLEPLAASAENPDRELGLGLGLLPLASARVDVDKL